MNTNDCRSEHTNESKYKSHTPVNSGNKGLLIAATFGLIATTLMGLSVPFLLPAFRRICLPYLPASEVQLENLKQAFHKHAIRNSKMLDIGSGDGRIVFLAAESGLFTAAHGVELNPILVCISRLGSLKSGLYGKIKFFTRDLWKFPIDPYRNISIFGVDTMMQPLEDYIIKSSTNEKIIFACRFGFPNLKQIASYGNGIDTVWVYKLSER